MHVDRAPIPGMLVLRLDVHEDHRGWFKENWQREEMIALGLPDFGPAQNNVAFNRRRGVTRGIHAEPWDKLVSLATGRAFGAWVDLREGDSFGTMFYLEMDPATAVFVPRGVGNSYQALEDGTAYTYLVNDHWRPGVAYTALDLGDPTAAIPWPIPLERAEVSTRDRANPRLQDVTPMQPRRILITGASGQLGAALAAEFPEAHAVGRHELDIADPAAVASWPWHEYAVVLNAAAYTAVDAAESLAGRVDAWRTNAAGVSALATAARDHRLTLVHFSTDYVFDGTAPEHDEDEQLSPLGVYGQSKAAGDLAAETAPRHYVIRTSWVVGDGPNFVRTMSSLAERGVSPSVVEDQLGRLTFTPELARATRHLLATDASFGTYNVTNSGPVTSWVDLARAVYRMRGRDENDITPVTTEEYAAGRTLAPRPRWSTLSLDKILATGFVPEDAGGGLERYLAHL